MNETDLEKIINQWSETSDEDYETMILLYKSKKYDWALFLGHISVEKLLKAYFVKIKKKHSPPIHNLLRIAEKGGLEIPDDYKDWLDEISLFNINARYDDYKKEFYSQCTEDFTDLWIKRIKELRKWIKQKLMK